MPPAADATASAASAAKEVVLEAGDVLYVPPFWAHRVTSLSTAVSLSVISPSPEEARWGAAYWQLQLFSGPR